jgi:hypothetical protein
MKLLSDDDLVKSIMYLRRFKWIVWRKMNCNQKDPPCIWTISRTHNRSLPMEHVFSNRA